MNDKLIQHVPSHKDLVKQFIALIILSLILLIKTQNSTMLADPVVSLKCISTIDIDYPSIFTTISQEETASEPFDLCQQRVSWHGTSSPGTVSKKTCSLKQEVNSAQNTCWLTIIWGQLNS
jgi:hypothetical protein